MQSDYTHSQLFEQTLIYPDPDCQTRLASLVGLDDKKDRLAKMLGLLVNPSGLEKWAREHHPGANNIVERVLRRPPLVVLAGDVGSGKTELAETIGDAVARQESIEITLLPLSLATRGQGRVGEMTQMLSAAFEHAVQEANKLKRESGSAKGAVILLVDEADSIAQSRESSQMHHEDRAGVNTFIRGIDRIGNGELPAAVIMCTNRPKALDPAIKRRAADILIFSRPNEEQRRTVLSSPLEELGFTPAQISRMVSMTGIIDDRDYGYTFSDLTQQLLPRIVLDAYPTRSVDPKRAIEIARSMNPTPPFNEEQS